MSFISIEYVVLLCVVMILYFTFSLRWRIPLILVASYVFYAFANINYVLLILFSTLVDYIAAQQIHRLDKQKNSRQRKAWLLASLVANLGVLFTFKYFNFFIDSLSNFLNIWGVENTFQVISLILPVGISFYTFQSMAYTIDVFRGKIQPERNPLIFATYVAYFPQLVAGPIERAGNMLPQLRKQHAFDYDRIVSGLRLILWGAFKKIVIADRLAIYVNFIYNDVDQYSGLPLLVATFFFTFQIYCDFSGYSDMAIGSARIFGIDLMTNFRQPYFAISLRDFWRRWHISLSTWFRDYVYIPLGGNRVSWLRQALNLLVVFVVSGLWHGAGWTFVVWGAIHGAFVVVETALVNSSLNRYTLNIWLRRILTFVIVYVTWIFFRANSLDDAVYILSNLLDFSDGRLHLLRPFFSSEIDSRLQFALALGVIGLLLMVEWLNMRTQLIVQMLQYVVIRWLLYYAALLAIITSLLLSPLPQPFVYFQF